MTVVPLSQTGPFPDRHLDFAGGRDGNFNNYMQAKTSTRNWIRNGGFESWTGGATGSRPDCWWVNAYGTYNRDSSPYVGKYCCRVRKSSTDGGASALENGNFWPWWNGGSVIPGHVWTFKIKGMADSTDGVDTVRLYAYDGTNYKYSDYLPATDEWEDLWATFYFPDFATRLKFGIEVGIPTGSNIDTYLDDATLTLGQYPLFYQECPDDRNLICQEWDDDGTFNSLRGTARGILITRTGTLTGGAATEVVAVTYSRPVGQTVHVVPNIVTLGGSTTRSVIVHATNYSINGFDFTLVSTSGAAFTAGWAYTLTATAFVVDYNNPGYQYE